MDISIVIINYNTFALTNTCIESIYEHTKDVSFEIILVDNASTENDPELFKIKFPEIILVKSSENIGFAKGNNLGIAKSKGDFILLLNSDAFFSNNVVLELFNFLIQHKEVAAVTSRLEYPDGTIQHNCQRFPSIKYKLFELFRLQKFFPKLGGKVLLGSFFDYNSLVYPDWIWGTCFMFKRNLLVELPKEKLADDFFMYVEDVQWCLDFHKLGYRVAFNPMAKVVHHMGKSGGNKSALMEHNMQTLIAKYYSPKYIKLMQVLDRMLT